jgi:hypothetical protein
MKPRGSDRTGEWNSGLLRCILSGARRGVAAAGALAAILQLGCATVAQIPNLSEEPCARRFESQLSSILAAQGEKPEDADALARRTRTSLTLRNLGPRPFLVSAPSGADYSFFVQEKRSGCLLRLYRRHKGFASYTNNLTYIATRPLPDCLCTH